MIKYTGPAKPIPVRVGEKDPMTLVEVIALALGLCIVLMDVFVWRP